jgi:hypothetical protein
MTNLRSVGPANSFAIPVDRSAVAHFANSVRTYRLRRVKPYGGWNSDLEWLSTTSRSRFRAFEQAFVRLGIAEHIRHMLDLDQAPRLYSGFVMQRSFCEAPHYHTDWKRCDRQAWTFITPISDARPDFGLLFKSADGSVRDYHYVQGEGVLIGDDALHSPMPCNAETPLQMLCFTFGTDKMEYWPRIDDCHSGQSVLTRRADGRFVRDWTYSDGFPGLASRALRKAKRLLRRG